MCTYTLRQVLNECAQGLDVLGLLTARILHHGLHVTLHLREVSLLSEYAHKQQVLRRDILVVVGLNFSGLLFALFQSLLHVAEIKWRLHHVEYVKIVVHF